MSTAKHPESDKTIVPDKYKGYPIVGVRGEFRGLDGGFNKGTSVQGVPTELDVFFAGKARQKGERYDYVVKAKNGDWRSYGPDDTEPEGVIYVRIYVSLFAMFADEELVGKAVHSVMEAAAKAEALRKEGQQAFTISEDDPTLTVVELNDLRKALTASGVPDSEDDRHAYITRVLGEMPSALHQSHQETILADLQEQLDAEREDDNEPGEHSEEHAMKGKVNEIFQPPNLASVPSEAS